MRNKNLRSYFIIIGIIVVSIILIVGIPLIINELYLQNTGYFTLWGAKEVLSYYGTILGTVGAIFGVFFTVKHSQNQYKEEQRNRVKPYLSFLYNDITIKEPQHPQKHLTVYTDMDDIYDTYDYSDFDYARFDGMHKKIKPFNNGIVRHEYYIDEFSNEKLRVFEIRFKNVGKGIAKSLVIEYKKIASGKIDLRVDEEMLIILYLHDSKPDNLNFKIKYENLFDDLFEVTIYIRRKNSDYLPEIIYKCK